LVRMSKLFAVSLCAGLFLCACVQAPGPKEEPSPAAQETSLEAEPRPEAAEADQPEPEAEEEAVDAGAEAAQGELPKAEEERQEFVVTEELYQQTFEDIEAVIAQLNALIRDKDYDAWLEYLTESYISQTSEAEYLGKWIKDPDKRTLQTYFLEVVVPTRSRVKLDEIEFIDDARVCAYTEYKGEKYLLYYLVKTEEGWKIDFY